MADPDSEFKGGRVLAELETVFLRAHQSGVEIPTEVLNITFPEVKLNYLLSVIKSFKLQIELLQPRAEEMDHVYDLLKRSGMPISPGTRKERVTEFITNLAQRPRVPEEAKVLLVDPRGSADLHLPPAPKGWTVVVKEGV